MSGDIKLTDHHLALQRAERRLRRRGLLRGGLSPGGLTLLTGCNLSDGDTVDKLLWAMSRFNDKVQSWLFDLNQLAPTFAEKDITTPFPFNAFIPRAVVPRSTARPGS